MYSLEQFFKLNFRVGGVVAEVGRPYVAVGVNERLCRFFGRSRDEMMQPGIFAEISHPADLEREQPLMQELLAGERDHYGLLKRYTHRGGEQIQGYVDVTLMRDGEGAPKKTFGVVIEPRQMKDLRDLLERRQVLVAALADADAQLVLGALRITEEEGVTRRELARSLGVGLSTVQGWIDRARALR